MPSISVNFVFLHPFQLFLLFPPRFFQVIWCFFLLSLPATPHFIFFHIGMLSCCICWAMLSAYSFTVTFSSRNAVSPINQTHKATPRFSFNGGIPQLIAMSNCALVALFRACSTDFRQFLTSKLLLFRGSPTHLN
uniref:hypothetical protein n=1 Tax=Salmonella sp. TaxID=599 RepID=UPI001CDA486F|nr:hypothetical protein [Salmonella sp.]